MSADREYLDQFYKVYTDSTTKLSDINRKLVYAGFAVIWIFRVAINDNDGTLDNNTDHFQLAGILRIALAFLVASLILDFLQYLLQGLSIKFYIWQAEDKVSKNESIKEYKGDTNIVNALWWLKLFTTLIAFILIIIFSLDNIR